MQPLDVLLADRLGARADTRSYIRVGTGLSQPSLDWIARARLQAARLRPDAVVVFLGANEGLDMTTGTGIEVACCGADWQAEYALRAAAIMRAYSRRGRARVVWLALPAPRQPERALIVAAVNAAARAAAVQLGGVRIVALDALFTPGFRYRAFMPVGRAPRARARRRRRAPLARGRRARRARRCAGAPAAALSAAQALAARTAPSSAARAASPSGGPRPT